MAPEQIEGRVADCRADLFAAGLIIFETLAGYPPFNGNSYPDRIRSLSRPPRALPAHDDVGTGTRAVPCGRARGRGMFRPHDEHLASLVFELLADAISALGVDSSAMLVGNGVQGALRLNGTIDAPVQPFVFGGAAWRRYDLTNTSINTSDLAGSDDVLEIPMGVGLSGRWAGQGKEAEAYG